MHLDSNSIVVWEHISNNFETEHIYVKAQTFLPGGMLVVNENGDTMLFWHDIILQKVIYEDGKNIGREYSDKIGTHDLEVYGIK